MPAGVSLGGGGGGGGQGYGRGVPPGYAPAYPTISLLMTLRSQTKPYHRSIGLSYHIPPDDTPFSN